jgi:integrase/recombinase XerD
MMKLDSLLLKFTEYLKISGFSPRTIESYTQNVRYFLDFLTELKIENIAEVDRRLLADYQARVYLSTYRGKPLAAGTQRGRLVPVQHFYQYLLKAGVVLHDPTSKLDLPRTPKQLPKNILTKKEIGALLGMPKLTTARGIRDRAILEVFYSTGIRVSELINLTVHDLDLKNQELRINKGKGNKDRIVPLGENACDFLEMYLRESRPKFAPLGQNLLFVNKSGRKFSRSHLHCMINRYAKKAGLATTGPHAIRHTCATHLLKGKADIRQIQELLGHACISSTQIYTRVEISDLKKVLRRYHPREKGEIETNER